MIERMKIIQMLTQEHYIPKMDNVQLAVHIMDFINKLETHYCIDEDIENINVFSVTHAVPLFTLEIKEHNHVLDRLVVLDKSGIIINLLKDLKEEDKSFLVSVLEAAGHIHEALIEYASLWEEIVAKEPVEGTLIHVDLQESGYTPTSEEATLIKNVLAKMAALKGINFETLKEINFKLSFEGKIQEKNPEDDPDFEWI